MNQKIINFIYKYPTFWPPIFLFFLLKENLSYVSGFRESGEKQITLRGLDSTTFETILTYMYTGEDVVDATNVQLLLMASVMLQIHSLQQICDSFLADHLAIDNCLGIWKVAASHNLSQLQKKAWNFIMKHFPYICQGKIKMRLFYLDFFICHHFDDMSFNSVK